MTTIYNRYKSPIQITTRAEYMQARSDLEYMAEGFASLDMDLEPDSLFGQLADAVKEYEEKQGEKE
jgi:hypothetical protein